MIRSWDSFCYNLSMKNQKGSITIITIILIVIALSIGGFYFYTQQKVPVESPITVTAKETENIDEGLKCYVSEKYFVIFKDNKYGPNGILVKRRIGSQQNNCTYIVNKDDAEFSEEEMLGIYGDFIVTGSEAPFSTELSIYDLRSRKKVFSDLSYGHAEVIDGVLSYMKREEATEKNCPEFKQYIKSGNGAALLYHVTLSLADFTSERTKQTERCIPTQ